MSEIPVDWQPYDIVLATFDPQRRDDLQRGVDDWIGRRLFWQAVWIIEDGPYAGQFAWAPIGNLSPGDRPLPPMAWAPFCDLADIERRPRSTWGGFAVRTDDRMPPDEVAAQAPGESDESVLARAWRRFRRRRLRVVR